MTIVQRTVTVQGDRQKVWDYLADFTRTEEWDPPTVSTHRVSGDGGVGTVYRNVSAFFGKKSTTDYTVVTYDAPERLVLTGDAGPMMMRDTIELEQDGGQVHVRYTSQFHPQGVLRVITPLLPLGLKKVGDDTARQLEECLRAL